MSFDRQKRRELEKRLKHPTFREGFKLGRKMQNVMLEEALHRAIQKTPGIGAKRKEALRQQIYAEYAEVRREFIEKGLLQ